MIMRFVLNRGYENSVFQNQYRQPSFFAVVWASTLKDLLIAVRYIPNFIGNLMQIVIRILFFFLFSSFVTYQGGKVLKGDDLFIFFLGAILVWLFYGVALNAPLNSVTSDLQNGTLEYLYSTPISRYAYYIGSVLSSAFVNFIIFIPVYITLVIYAKLGVYEGFMILATCVSVIVGLMAMGVMIALLGLLWRQVGSIIGVLFLLFEFLAGAYFPVSQFPILLQYISYLLPFTWGYDLVRYYSFKSNWNTIVPLWLEWTALLVFAIAYTIISVILLQRIETTAKKKGLNIL